ncbi:hypothetical protein KDH_24410 [Dictyobacter sp. S3.2.2.5]|uniref:Uncharacterized protein n=1 Tax=Dictyobacter halimunensis TaxID=3026934 RepID=A0ABQ6FT62_9CHLR|nr:hypothetical protein KDH_24410 [Dictyobacter sp. S3.2.2.5]
MRNRGDSTIFLNHFYENGSNSVTLGRREHPHTRVRYAAALFGSRWCNTVSACGCTRSLCYTTYYQTKVYTTC